MSRLTLTASSLTVGLLGIGTLASAPIRLNPALPSGHDVTAYDVSADGQLVVYRADAAVDGQYELYTVSVAGGVATRLNETLSPGASVA